VHTNALQPWKEESGVLQTPHIRPCSGTRQSSGLCHWRAEFWRIQLPKHVTGDNRGEKGSFGGNSNPGLVVQRRTIMYQPTLVARFAALLVGAISPLRAQVRVHPAHPIPGRSGRRSGSRLDPGEKAGGRGVRSRQIPNAIHHEQPFKPAEQPGSLSSAWRARTQGCRVTRFRRPRRSLRKLGTTPAQSRRTPSPARNRQRTLIPKDDNSS